MTKCKYSGDTNDEYCKNCNGCTMMIDGKEFSCKECSGYETDNIEDASTNSKEPKMSKEPKQENTTNEVEKITEIKSQPITEKVIVEDTNNTSKVKSIKYMSGITVVKNDVYYKFSAEEEWELNPDSTNEDIEKSRKMLWDKLNSEVDTQVENLS